MEYRKISTVLKRYSFEQKMSIAHEYSIPWVNGVDESLAQTGLPLPWELETFVLFSVTSREWCNNSFDIKNQHIFSEIITSIRNYKPPKIQAVTGTPMLIKKLLTSVGITQFEIQEKPINKLFRYNYFFNFSNDRIDMPTVFREKFGCSYKEVLSAILGVLLSYSVLKEGLSPKEFAALYRLYPEVINILCIPRDDYISKLSKITSDYRDYNYCLRPSYSYPFIVDNNVIYLPLPHLLLQSITSSLLFRLTDGRNDLQKTIGKEVIEAYLFKIICASKAFDAFYVFYAYLYHLLHKHEEPPNSLKQGRFAALRSPKFLSCLKMCTLSESRKRPALRGFVGGRCALGCTSLYHSAIFERAHPDENAAKTPPNAARSPAGVSTLHLLP